MIRSDKELKAVQERTAAFEQILLQLRVTASAEEFPLVASGYRAEIQRMQAETLDYLTRHSSAPSPTLVS